jgi:hypothetical protein
MHTNIFSQVTTGKNACHMLIYPRVFLTIQYLTIGPEEASQFPLESAHGGR